MQGQLNKQYTIILWGKCAEIKLKSEFRLHFLNVFYLVYVENRYLICTAGLIDGLFNVIKITMARKSPAVEALFKVVPEYGHTIPLLSQGQSFYPTETTMRKQRHFRAIKGTISHKTPTCR